MSYVKARLFAVAIIVIFAALTYYNWQQLFSEGRYSLKMAAFGPVGVVGGIFLVFFPSKFGKPTTTIDKVLVLFVFGIGIVAGLINWYLMDPGYFGM